MHIDREKRSKYFRRIVFVCFRVLEPACFGAAPALGILNPEPAPAPAPGKREHNFEFFKTDYE